MSSPRSPPPVPSSTRPSAPSSSRSLLLRIPNAKALRLVDNDWRFIALGDLSIYQIEPSGQGSQKSASPPPIPARLPINMNNSTSSPSSMTQRLNSPNSAVNPSTRPSSSQPGIIFCVRTAEFPLANTGTVTFEDPNCYILDNGEGFVVRIELEGERKRDGKYEILDNIIRRYSSKGSFFPGTPVSSGASTPELLPQDCKNQLLLYDENTGKVMGQLNQSMPISEGQNISGAESPGQMSSSDPVVIYGNGNDEDDDLDLTDQRVQVSAFSDVTRNYGKSNSRIVGAAEFLSQSFLSVAEYGANYTNSATKNYTERTKATDNPLVFSDTTKQSVAKVASATETAAKYSKMTIGFIASKAEQVGGAAMKYGSRELESMGVIDNSSSSKKNRDGGIRGVFRSSVQAGLTLVEGVEKGGKHFLETGRQSTNTIVGHKYGEEAKAITNDITSAGSNVILVYVDARGVMHRALVMKVGKGLGKGVVKARLKDGRQVTLDESSLKGSGQHTETDEKTGETVLVDDESSQQVQDINHLGHTTAIENQEQQSNTGYDMGQQGLTHRINKVPPIPPRMT